MVLCAALVFMFGLLRDFDPLHDHPIACHRPKGLQTGFSCISKLCQGRMWIETQEKCPGILEAKCKLEAEGSKMAAGHLGGLHSISR
jgi:hypothetical protein